MSSSGKVAGADIAKFQLGWRANPDEINCITPKDLLRLSRFVNIMKSNSWHP